MYVYFSPCIQKKPSVHCHLRAQAAKEGRLNLVRQAEKAGVKHIVVITSVAALAMLVPGITCHNQSTTHLKWYVIYVLACAHAPAIVFSVLANDHDHDLQIGLRSRRRSPSNGLTPSQCMLLQNLSRRGLCGDLHKSIRNSTSSPARPSQIFPHPVDAEETIVCPTLFIGPSHPLPRLC